MVGVAVVSVLFVILLARRITRAGPGTGTPAGRFAGWIALTLVIVLIFGLLDGATTLHVIGGFFDGIKTAVTGIAGFLNNI
ncbi:MAG TPA: hypothetical protein VJ370_10545 [Streptosporangiaceae bacterium]|jgi:hypothetical protein|nr:hypothetical protein [Streptosporangiaceae bacterium]HJZ26702.1 hypothetical protein [Streptosporangiaceae bacterium]